MTTSRASRPMTSSRVNPVARSHASLNSRIRPSRSYTQTSDWVVSVRTRANESPTTNSSLCGCSSSMCGRSILERLGCGKLHGCSFVPRTSPRPAPGPPSSAVLSHERSQAPPGGGPARATGGGAPGAAAGYGPDGAVTQPPGQDEVRRLVPPLALVVAIVAVVADPG